MTTHSPGCGGDEAPWCSPGCSANPLYTTLPECARDLHRSAATIRRQCRPAAYDERGRALYDLHKLREWFAGVPTRKRKAS